MLVCPIYTKKLLTLLNFELVTEKMPAILNINFLFIQKFVISHRTHAQKIKQNHKKPLYELL